MDQESPEFHYVKPSQWILSNRNKISQFFFFTEGGHCNFLNPSDHLRNDFLEATFNTFSFTKNRK